MTDDTTTTDPDVVPSIPDSPDTGRQSTEVSRRQYLAGGAAALSNPALVGVQASMLPGGWGSDDTVTPLARSLPDVGVTHGGDGQPSWYIRYTAGSRDSLKDWVDADADRRIVREHPGLNGMTIRASHADVGIRVFFGRARPTSGLRERSYVDLIDRNITASLAEPIRRLDEPADWNWELSYAERFELLMRGQSRPASDGVAFDGDAEPSTMAQQQAALRADEVDVDTSTLTIGVIDTGIKPGAVYEDANGNTRILDASTSYITDETVGEDGIDAVHDGNDHGMWVSSCSAARAPTSNDANHEGYLPGASILAQKALNDDGEGSTADIAAAIEDAANEGCDVICLSLGSPFWSQQLDDALEYAVDQGTIPVAAVGNDRLGSTWPASPADSEWAISVSATTVAPPDERLVAYFANVGPDPGTADDSGGDSAGVVPDVAAPGMKTTALTPDGELTLSGTSMGAPNTLGAIGLLLASAGGLSYQDVRDRLETYHRPLPRVAVNEAHYGAPDVPRAIDQVEPEDPQSAAMTDEAERRSRSYEAMSDAHGGLLTR